MTTEQDVQTDEKQVPLIVGADGQLGRALARELTSRYPETIAAGKLEVDVTDYFRMCMDFERLQPTLVVNCAAFTRVDDCETHPEVAEMVNAEGARHVARAASGVGARLVQISTDFVFPGDRREPYTEDDTPGPLSVYGQSKLAGEQAVLQDSRDHLVVRTSWLYGPDGRNFVTAILDRARRDEPLQVVADQVGSPTYAPDLAAAIVRLVDVGATGLVHYANTGACSRFAWARAAVELADLEAEIAPIRSDDDGRLARRPEFSALSTDRYTRLTDDLPRPWEVALSDYVDELRRAD